MVISKLLLLFRFLCNFLDRFRNENRIYHSGTFKDLIGFLVYNLFDCNSLESNYIKIHTVSVGIVENIWLFIIFSLYQLII